MYRTGWAAEVGRVGVGGWSSAGPVAEGVGGCGGGGGRVGRRRRRRQRGSVPGDKEEAARGYGGGGAVQLEEAAGRGKHAREAAKIAAAGARVFQIGRAHV